MLLPENDFVVQRVAVDFVRVYKKRGLRANVGKSKVMKFKRVRKQIFDFAKILVLVEGMMC